MYRNVFLYDLGSRYRYEKMVSGMYLGELVRLALVKLTETGYMFGGKLPPILKKKDAFYTKFVSEIEG